MPIFIGQDLNLDVPWLLDVLFQVDLRAAERGGGLSARHVQIAAQAPPRSAPADAASAAAQGRLDQDRVANLLCKLDGILLICQRPVGARNHGHAGNAHRLARGGLVAHLLHNGGRGADKLQAVQQARFREA